MFELKNYLDSVMFPIVTCLCCAVVWRLNQQNKKAHISVFKTNCYGFEVSRFELSNNVHSTLHITCKSFHLCEKHNFNPNSYFACKEQNESRNKKVLNCHKSEYPLFSVNVVVQFSPWYNNYFVFFLVILQCTKKYQIVPQVILNHNI